MSGLCADCRAHDAEVAALKAQLAEAQALVDAANARLKAIDDAAAAYEAELARHAPHCEIRWNTSAECDCGYPAEESRELAAKDGGT